MRDIAFTKMHGTGNDFIFVVEQKTDQLKFWTKKRIRGLCDRNIGIGADGVIVLIPLPKISRYTFQIFNADGSRAETCVNGLRCAALLTAAAGLHAVFETPAGPVATKVIRLDAKTATVQVEVGEPRYEAKTLQPLGRGNRKMSLTAVSIGNPHVVGFVRDFNFDWPEVATAVQQKAPFPRGTNVEFVRVVNRRKIEMRIFERGVGPTLSSGSGSIAAVYAARREDLIDNSVDVVMPGGTLKIKYDPRTDRMYQTGPAVEIYSGNIAVN